MSNPKKHHFLPQFYLEKFQVTDKSGKFPQIIIESKEKEPKLYRAAIHDTGCITDYYTVDIQGKPIDRSHIETELSKIESMQNDLINELILSNTIPESKITEISFLISSMHLRVPKFKRYIEDTLQKSLESVGETLLQHGRIPPIPDILKIKTNTKLRDIVDFKIDNWKLLSFMYSPPITKKLVSIINDMKMRIIEAPPGMSFITGDTPVSVYYPHYSTRIPYGVGFADEKIEMSFPLCPSKILVAAWKELKYKNVASTEELMEFNRRTIVMADKYLYYHKSCKEISKLVSQNAEITAGYRSDLLDRGKDMLVFNRFLPVTDTE